MIDIINIKIKVFVFVVIINSKTFNNDIFILIFNLIALKDKKDFAFIFDDFNFKTLILIVNKNDKIFVIKAILKSDKIANIVMN